ncbi:hypothetical protein Sjap_003914 [Stephania japonica]|uniref:Pentatricopeptide repeat-containing protein n=1 Tax=Stephania japonica TaxID=461633 RepID=A0AAP0KS44_9MAGN
MRNQWRLLRLRYFSTHSINVSRGIQPLNLLAPQNHRCISSFLGTNSHPSSVLAINFDVQTTRFRAFSSEPALDSKEVDHAVVIELISKSSSSDEFKRELESINASITPEMVLETLRNLENRADFALRFFKWVVETESGGLSSKDHVGEFWELFEVVKRRGFGVGKDTYVKVLDSFEKEGMVDDLEKLRKMYASKLEEISMETMGRRVCNLVVSHEWGEDVQKRIGEVNVSWSDDLVVYVVEHLSAQPMKALMFFWWLQESQSFKHNKLTYNAVVNVLARKDSIEKFWVVAKEMREAGYEMETKTYFKVIGKFYDRRMIKDSVELHEFMMRGANKPSAQDSLFLLRKIVVDKNLDMDLFGRVVKTSMEIGNGLTKSTLDGILKSLTSVGRLQECGKILKAMEKGGYAPTDAAYSKYIFHLSKAGRPDEAMQILNELKASGCAPNFKMWSSLIEGQCAAGEINKASSCFREMVENNEFVGVGKPLESLIIGFCRRKRAKDACQFLMEIVNDKQLQPWHSTYKTLITELLVRKGLKEALGLLPLMRSHGFPPFVDPFIDHISKYGTGEDAVKFLKGMTLQRFPSTSVVIRMFEAFFKARRDSEAHNCLAKCPSYLRNHADVLSLFCAMKPEDTVVSA